jgi:hypothetical protein
MVAYTFVRRSMMALSFSDAAASAIQHANLATQVPGAPASVRGLAAKQAAFGFALAGRAEESARALDAAIRLLAEAARDDDPTAAIGQRSVLSDDLHAIFEGTCQVYLGRGAAAIDGLTLRLDWIASGSARTSAITAAKIARASVDAGDPALACERIRAAAELADGVGSASARAELRRAQAGLARWPSRSDVRDVGQLVATFG